MTKQNNYSKQKIQKGEYGYIKAKRKNLIMWLVLDVLFAIGLFIIGLIFNEFSKANIFTIFAMIFTIPGAKIVVSLIVIAPYKAMLKEDYNKICEGIKDKKNVLYDLVLTSPERVMYITSLTVSKEEYIVLPNMSKKTDLTHIESYVKKHMSNYGFEKNIAIVKDEQEYMKKVLNSDLDVDKLDDIIKTLLILQV